ncbi:hypothetical protein EJ02DRAFT_436065 [Clathrospora elynae]|uniref:Ubiquitin 3 binding protein But2 C-terminal domain-containing protein n=1 Tax=Clathrospora elynae TaxID=706981 RepID=A0A6A5SIF1_9PLEO|nr:hypothetical protein EJ02DRAFT_436065 [Clathrospora elynae]
MTPLPMAAWIMLIVWAVACLLGSITAAPLEQSSVQALTIGNLKIPAGVANVVNAASYENSIQILLKRIYGDHYWTFYQGPQGLSVRACGDDNFKGLTQIGPFKYPSDPNIIDHPPFPIEMTVGISIKDHREGCSYLSTGGDAGRFVCEDEDNGMWLAVDCAQDSHWGDTTEYCADGSLMHHGFYCEH